MERGLFFWGILGVFLCGSYAFAENHSDCGQYVRQTTDIQTKLNKLKEAKKALASLESSVQGSLNSAKKRATWGPVTGGVFNFLILGGVVNTGLQRILAESLNEKNAITGVLLAAVASVVVNYVAGKYFISGKIEELHKLHLELADMDETISIQEARLETELEYAMKAVSQLGCV